LLTRQIRPIGLDISHIIGMLFAKRFELRLIQRPKRLNIV